MRSLRKGTVGSDVRVWQEFLAGRGFHPGPIDGIFGDKTHQATIAFQRNRGLATDGIVGNATFAAARELGFKGKLLVITRPTNNASFVFNQVVEFVGLAEDGITQVELTVDNQFDFPTISLVGSAWSGANRFRATGRRRIVAKGFNARDETVDTDALEIVVTAPNYRAEIPIPANPNPGVNMVTQRRMIEVFGEPCPKSTDCSPLNNERLRQLMVTRDVGPFTVTGLRPAVEALQRVFARVNQELPDLYEQLATAGMLCCRKVRGGANWSNHAWGTAIDMKIKGAALDPRGNGRSQLGLVLLAPFFNEEKFFWGAGFSGADEDSMHFEASADLINHWSAEGRI